MKYIVLVLSVVLTLPVFAEEGIDQELKALQSKVQSMSEGYYTDAEWSDLFAELRLLKVRAEVLESDEVCMELALLQSLAQGDLRHEWEDAALILEQALDQFGAGDSMTVRRMFVKLAEIYSIEGRAADLARLKERFRVSAAFDKATYDAWGAAHPDDPITIVRPASGETSDSSAMVAIEKFERRTDLAAGSTFPVFSGITSEGRSVSLTDYQGKVVLVDFWVTGWKPWERELETRRHLVKTYGKDGFVILGIAMDSDPAVARQTIDALGLDWPNILDHQVLPRQFNIFGEATSFLLDRSGTVVGRDLSGAKLIDAAKAAL